jgi:hypothetical protein
MTPKWNSALAHVKPQIDAIEEEDVVINDALGTIDLADSTGSDDELETGDAKILNFPTRED